jgi:hypothetical protein
MPQKKNINERPSWIRASRHLIKKPPNRERAAWTSFFYRFS